MAGRPGGERAAQRRLAGARVGVDVEHVAAGGGDLLGAGAHGRPVGRAVVAERGKGAEDEVVGAVVEPVARFAERLVRGSRLEQAAVDHRAGEQREQAAGAERRRPGARPHRPQYPRAPDAVNPRRESNGSQFYIALRALSQLDGGYTVFGKVLSGWDTIDRLVALAARKDIARVGENANPGKLALIRHARLVPRADWAGGKAPTLAAGRHTTSAEVGPTPAARAADRWVLVPEAEAPRRPGAQV